MGTTALALDLLAPRFVGASSAAFRPATVRVGRSEETRLSATSEGLGALLRRCGDGDRGAFRELYDRESPRLYGLALRLTRQPAVAADVVHDTMLQVWQKALRFDPERGSAEAWLSTMLRYRAIDAIRRTSREEGGAELPEVADTGPDAYAALAAIEETGVLRSCMDALEPAQHRVVTLAFFDGLSHSELAARLEAPLGTVKSWVRRALIALRRCIDAEASA